jgi:hypothetical protein
LKFLRIATNVHGTMVTSKFTMICRPTPFWPHQTPNWEIQLQVSWCLAIRQTYALAGPPDKGNQCTFWTPWGFAMIFPQFWANSRV